MVTVVEMVAVVAMVTVVAMVAVVSKKFLFQLFKDSSDFSNEI